MRAAAIKAAKRAALLTGKRVGLFNAVSRSRWRRQRLLILCYHGIAQSDENLWNPQLYFNAGLFRERLTILRRGGYSVLPLGEALDRLGSGSLPRRSVVITFDDGHSDFMTVAHPILREFGFPCTIYLTTYHVDDNVPIFALVVSYMLWKARGRSIDLAPWMGVGDGVTSLATEAGRAAAHRSLVRFAEDNELDSRDKQALAQQLANSLGVDFDDVRRRRILHLLNANEVRRLARDGVDFQLHTHCHRAPKDEAKYREQIRLNRDRICSLTGMEPVHFCYPSGVVHRSFLPWLSAEGVRSAVTCVPGLATPGSPPLLLPRLLDHEGLSAIEFGAWLDGLGEWLPRSAKTARAAGIQDVAESYS